MNAVSVPARIAAVWGEDSPEYAAVAELIEAARRAEVSFNTVRGCYKRNPGNFMVAMRELERDVLPLRAALARVGGDK